MHDHTPDPFADEKAPALSFKEHGTTYTGTVTGVPKLVQARDYESRQPDVWPDGNPKWTVVTNLDVNGEPHSLWAAQPSAMFAAIADAQKKAGARIALGGTLTITYSHDVANAKNPRLNAAKQYRVVYTPPVAADPLVDDLIADATRPPSTTVDDDPPF